MAINNSINEASDVQTFTSNGTWTKPNGAKMVYVLCIGAGGSGGAGRNGVGTGSNGWGGSGGGGGAITFKWFAASDLPNTVSIVVGAGGTAVASSSTNGNPGGNSSFGAVVVVQ